MTSRNSVLPRNLRLRVIAGLTVLAIACGTDSADSAGDGDEQIVTGRVAPAANGLPSVVMLEPQEPIGPLTPNPSVAIMDQFGMVFIPTLLLVQTNQTIEFRNSEDIAHNVRVVEDATDSTLFNVATLMDDPYRYRFERTGRYDVQCDIHPAMSAVVLVVSTPYAIVAEDSGEFTLAGVPAGSYTLSVWSADSLRRLQRSVQVRDGRTTLNIE